MAPTLTQFFEYHLREETAENELVWLDKKRGIFKLRYYRHRHQREQTIFKLWNLTKPRRQATTVNLKSSFNCAINSVLKKNKNGALEELESNDPDFRVFRMDRERSRGSPPPSPTHGVMADQPPTTPANNSILLNIKIDYPETTNVKSAILETLTNMIFALNNSEENGCEGLQSLTIFSTGGGPLALEASDQSAIAIEEQPLAESPVAMDAQELLNSLEAMEAEAGCLQEIPVLSNEDVEILVSPTHMAEVLGNEQSSSPVCLAGLEDLEPLGGESPGSLPDFDPDFMLEDGPDQSPIRGDPSVMISYNSDIHKENVPPVAGSEQTGDDCNLWSCLDMLFH